MGFDGYQSGGRYIDPERQYNLGVQRELKKSLGGSAQGHTASEITGASHALVDRIAQGSQLPTEEIDKLKTKLTELESEFSNVVQLAKAQGEVLGKFVTYNNNAQSGFINARGTATGNDPASKVLSSPMLQLININNNILKTLQDTNRALNNLGGNLTALDRDMFLIDKSNDNMSDLNHQESIDEFESLKSTIINSVLNSPTATKLGMLGSSLMHLGLMKVAGNENLPTGLRKVAAEAMYLQVPETITGVLGHVVEFALAGWLNGKVFPLVGNIFKGLLRHPMLTGKVFGTFAQSIGKFLGWTMILGGAVMGIKGMFDHHKQMKDLDKDLANNKNLTEKERDSLRLKAHAKSGAEKGALAGDLMGKGAGALLGAKAGAGIGAAIGSIIPGLGTAVGGAVGGLLGGIVGFFAGGKLGNLIGKAFGGIIGSIKPLFIGMFHWGRTTASFVKEGFKASVGMFVRFLKGVAPIANTLLQILGVFTPFGLIMKAIWEKLSDWFGGGNSGGGSSPQTVDNPGSSNAVGRNVERALNKGSTKYTKDSKGNAYLGGHLITSNWGWRVHPKTGSAKDGQKHFHKGIDLAYKEGENVGAFVGGKVVFAGMGSKANGRSGYGNTVEIMDDKGVIHKYHHGKSIPKEIMDAYKNGGSIKKGDVIMQAGKTGYATGTHLDYETWQGKTNIDPLKYLGERAEEEARKKEEEEKAKKEQFAKDHPILNAAEKGANFVENAGKKVVKDITHIGAFTDKQNQTTKTVTEGHL